MEKTHVMIRNVRLNPYNTPQNIKKGDEVTLIEQYKDLGCPSGTMYKFKEDIANNYCSNLFAPIKHSPTDALTKELADSILENEKGKDKADIKKQIPQTA